MQCFHSQRAHHGTHCRSVSTTKYSLSSDLAGTKRCHDHSPSSTRTHQLHKYAKVLRSLQLREATPYAFLHLSFRDSITYHSRSSVNHLWRGGGGIGRWRRDHKTEKLGVIPYMPL